MNFIPGREIHFVRFLLNDLADRNFRLAGTIVENQRHGRSKLIRPELDDMQACLLQFYFLLGRRDGSRSLYLQFYIRLICFQ